jgi:hypothetical protein
MVGADNILLVEGESDKAFFSLICKNHGLNTSVRVAHPKDLASSHNSKEGVFNHLPIQLQQLADGQTLRLAVVVDADSDPNGGFEKTRDRVSGILAPFGYQLAGNQAAGLIYQHNNGLADFGLWIMPDNANAGMLEDWIKQCMDQNEQGLFTHAVTAIDTLPVPPKFSPIHRSKAEVATWMAWQKKPGHGLYRAIEDGLLDTNSPLYQDLSRWLQHVFIAIP